MFKSEQKKRQFLNRLQGELAKRGIIDVLRNGIKVYPVDLIMFYLTPTENNIKARELFEKNIFSVTRQLRYSQDAGKLALDLCVFINGLPVITFELKNQLTKQNTDDAVEQYKTDRDPRDTLFSFKRCMVHFALDDARVKFCTKLCGKDSWFLPFDKGYNDGAGNPPNPDGIMTDYLWKDILTKRKLSRIIENYAQVVEEVDPETKKKSVKQIFPRYHQLDVVEKLLADVKANGVGQKYLIQHSAGSGKSNSIAWLAHQLIGLEKDGHPMIDSVIVVTDRRILDKQIRDTIKQFMQVSNTVVWAEHSGDLTKAITDGKRIIVTTIEKFPFIVPQIGAEHKNHHFAIIIDEAHSGQSGRNSAQMNLALSGLASDDEMDNEDKINTMMEGRKLLGNASYFAFTATPKNKTLKKGQFAMNKMKAWQGSYGVSDYTGIVSPAYFIFDIDFDNLKYFHYAIRSKVYVNFFAQTSDGIRVGQWDLQMDKMKEIPFIVPPADEQIQIVEYIESALPKYDDAICVLREEIRGLEELKTKLMPSTKPACSVS